MEIDKAWSKLVAANGLIGISADVDKGIYKQSVSKVFEFLSQMGPRIRLLQVLLIFSAAHVPDDVNL